MTLRSEWLILSSLCFALAYASDNLVVEKPTYTLKGFRVLEVGSVHCSEDMGDVPIESGP